jgi:hypothetical protein
MHQLDAAVFVIPDKDQVYKQFASEEDRDRPNRVLAGLLDELRLPYIDLLPYLLAASETSADPLYNMTQAGHLSAPGHRLASRVLLKYLEPK